MNGKEIRFVDYEFRICVHCCAKTIKECAEKVNVNGKDTLPARCWREDLIKDKPEKDDN